MRTRAATTIEILLLVAVVSILATIAVAQLSDGEIAAMVAQAYSDMHAIGTALESYKIDTNKYPPDYQYYQGWSGEGHLTDRFASCVLGWLTTPVAYITSVPDNVFVVENSPEDDGKRYQYYAEDLWRRIIVGDLGFSPSPYLFSPETGEMDANMGRYWALVSVGPDRISNVGSYIMFGEHVLNRIPGFPDWGYNDGCVYDATNGTISDGDLVRTGPPPAPARARWWGVYR